MCYTLDILEDKTMKTKEQAKKQVERIMQRLVKRLDAKQFKTRVMRLLDYVHITYC